MLFDFTIYLGFTKGSVFKSDTTPESPKTILHQLARANGCLLFINQNKNNKGQILNMFLNC